MNTQQRIKIYLVLILLSGVGLALAVPALAQAHASTSSDQLSPSATGNKIVYVAKSGDGSYGNTWTQAFTNVHAALDVAFSGDRIYVATGVYTPGLQRSDSFRMKPGVALYGGFDPEGGADYFGERDWQTYPTILSGDIARDDTNTNGVVLTTTHINGANSYHVVTADGTSAPITGSAVLDGFIITAGQANGGAVPDNRGGGYYCDGSGSGGECSPSLRNVTFSGNYAEYGGAMYNLGNNNGTSNPSLEEVSFSGNSAANNGGAMINNGNTGDSSPSLSYVTFTGNSADTHGGAIYNYGQNGTSSPSMTNVTFSGNHADYGGAMANQGSFGASSPSLDDVIFSGNFADEDGGAMFNRATTGTSSPTMTNVVFSGNSAGSQGGAMYTDGELGNSSPTLTNVVFSSNSAGSQGGAMFNRDPNGNSNPKLVNVTFSGNTAQLGGAMYNYYYNGISGLSLSNLILWGNTASTNGSQLYNSNVNVTVTTSLVQGGLTGSGVFNNNSSIIDGGGNLAGDPDFLRDPDPGSDGNWDGVADDYGDLHLGSSSPAIDTGTNSAISLPTDLDGHPRVVDGDGDGTAIVDMGAYEFNCPAGGILYVDHSANGGGGSWLDAKPDLALGLHLVGYCPDVSQVWVATGVYTPGLQRTDSFDLVPGVAVYGGFDPAGGDDEFSERDWEAYPTILSGDIDGDDFKTDGVVPTAFHIFGSNSYHVVTGSGVTTTAVLDGFTITAGKANGIYVEPCGQKCGAGMYNESGSPTLANVNFSGNWAGGSGGGMYNYSNSSPTLANVIFSGNWADGGGGMYNRVSNPLLTNVTLSGNTAADENGGGMLNVHSSPTLANVIFSGNQSIGSGGGMANMYNGSPQLSDVIFSGNTAGYDGGAMYNIAWKGTVSPTLDNVTFSGNSAGRNGGAIANRALNGTSSPSLSNVTFSGNHADSNGGAMFNDGEEGTSSPSLSNIILWGNTAVISGSQLFNNVASVAITTSLVQGGITGGGVFNDNSTVTDGGGNLDADPDFVRAPDPGPDGSWDGVGDDYGDLHLGSGSPAIDTGTNSAISLPTDLDGNPRVLDGDGDGTTTVDMGAYEFQAYTLNVSLAGSGSGTVTGDSLSCAAGSNAADCTESYPDGTIVTLTASADPGSTFTGWSGACNHTDPVCTVAMVDARSVTATFTLNQYLLSVSLAGSGAGTVSSTPPGIDCAAGGADADCTENYNYGSLVSLTAAADSGSTFSGWGGTCAGAGDCDVTMSEALSITAVFEARFVYLPSILR